MSAPRSLLFVYGTLMPGEPRWSVLAPFVDGEPRRATVAGLLVDTGRGYPALFDGDAAVPGYVVRLRDDSVERALSVLDEVEGTSFGLFERGLVDVGSQRAWVYRGHDPALRGTPIDAWPAAVRPVPAPSPAASAAASEG